MVPINSINVGDSQGNGQDDHFCPRRTYYAHSYAPYDPYEMEAQGEMGADFAGYVAET